jgi:hypothetical protein
VWAEVAGAVVVALLGFFASELRRRRQDQAAAKLEEAERAIKAYAWKTRADYLPPDKRGLHVKPGSKPLPPDDN